MRPVGERRSLAEVYAVPTLLAAASAVGLVSALLGDGVWDAVSWIGLALPLVPLGALPRRRQASA